MIQLCKHHHNSVRLDYDFLGSYDTGKRLKRWEVSKLKGYRKLASSPACRNE